jgi:transcriptional regulator with XRE-family HTH domain
MPSPTLAEHAYTAYCAALGTPQPAYHALPFAQRFAWSQALAAGVAAALALPGEPAPAARRLPDPAPEAGLAALLATLRQDWATALAQTQGSVNRLSRRVGVNRRTLTAWLRGEDHITVTTLRRLAACLPAGREPPHGE